MTADRELERVVRSWIREDGREDADRVLNAVLSEIDTTSQHRATSWPVRRTPTVNKFFGVAVAAAAIVVAAVIGYRLLISKPDVGPPVGTPVPTPTTAPATSVTSDDVGRSLARGRYAFTIGPGQAAVNRMFDVELSLPKAWQVQQVSGDEVAFWESGQGGPYVGFFEVWRVYKDPCHPEDGFIDDSARNRNATEIANELQSLAGFEIGSSSELTVGGLPATHFTISNTIDTQAEGCTDGNLLPLFATWEANRDELTERTDNSPATNGGTTEEIWVVDRMSYPLVIVGEAGTADPDRGRQIVEDIINSIAIE